MKEYHKIHTLFKRDMVNDPKHLIEGAWTNKEFEYLSNNEWEFTEKVDGTNIRIMFDGESISYGGRTDKADIPKDLLSRLQDLFEPLTTSLREKFPKGVCIYGEGYGPKIQNGGKYKSVNDFVIFDVLVGQWWLGREAVCGIAADLGVDSVPVIGYGTLFDAISMAKSGISSIWGDFEAEGIVARPTVELKHRNGDRIITKIKCCDFK